MNFAELEEDELEKSSEWAAALVRHPRCLLKLGYHLVRSQGWEFPNECPGCHKPILGDDQN